MSKPYKFCPHCGNGLKLGIIDEHEQLVCSAACGFVHWKNPIPVVAVLIEVAGKYVLVQRGKDEGTGKWCMPCGFVNEGESLTAAACRETLEETHLVVTVPDLPFKIVNLSAINEHLHFFKGTIISGTLEAGDDAIDAGYFAADALPEMAFNTHTEVLLAA
ncbi:MAG: NUDIX hydrolase [Candidatus Obscuribacterales bacterium]|nr:NUDIX hydrolase [Candidatus Obscuribacterales bacterium]